jgi:Ca2+-binding RTX toxin-like protein
VWFDHDTENNIFTVTWDDVSDISNYSRSSAFQLQMIDQGGEDFDFVFRYEAVNFYDTRTNANAGYDVGTTTWYQLPQSFTAGANNLENEIGNTGQLGVWAWHVRDGVIAEGFEVNEAPVIVTENISVQQVPDTDYDTTVFGLAVTDGDDTGSQIFHISATAGHGTLSINGGAAAQSVGASASLNDINEALAGGVTYLASDNPAAEETDIVTVTVTDNEGATDAVNFIFNVTGQQQIDLAGTTGKDIIFGTGYSDNLTGDTGNDTFVFSPSDTNFGTDTITDFKVGGASLVAEMDKIMFGGGSLDDIEDLIISYETDPGNAVITGAAGTGFDGSITLEGVTSGLAAQHFIFRPQPAVLDA